MPESKSSTRTRKSGASAVGRDGFQRLTAQVALGEVGTVLGLEVSRLARSCADWHRLLEVAALTHTLIVDEDGVYDPRHVNDRLLLGLKGTLSEAELVFLKQRMIGGRRNKARRGEFRLRLPAGYVWEEGEGVRMDPDERVRDTVGLLFRSFDRLGSAGAVAREFADQGLRFPRRDGFGSVKDPVLWGRLSISRALHTLKNPIYAGSYVYARHAPHAVDPEDPAAGGRILLPSAHPGYLSQEQFEKNVARLATNRSVYGEVRSPGSAREGGCLLQGIALCSVCGRRMSVYYRASRVWGYTCRCPYTSRVCQELNGWHVDELIEQQILEALRPEELELAVGALEQVEERAREIGRQWEKRIEAARYEADRAARRYRQVEPENRLVARTLESDWNAQLENLERLETEHRDAQRKPPLQLTAEQRRKIHDLAHDVPRLWKAPTTKNSQRKQIVRLLIEDVALRVLDEPFAIAVAVRWKTGTVTRHRAVRMNPTPHATSERVLARIRSLYLDKMDSEIAEILNAEGYRTGYRKLFTAESVSSLRLRNGLPKRKPSEARS